MEDLELKKQIEVVIAQMFSNWDCSEVAQITDAISEDVEDDIKETSDYPFHNDSDVRIAVKRVVLSKIYLAQ